MIQRRLTDGLSVRGSKVEGDGAFALPDPGIDPEGKIKIQHRG
jgi:hypothetical protein